MTITLLAIELELLGDLDSTFIAFAHRARLVAFIDRVLMLDAAVEAVHWLKEYFLNLTFVDASQGLIHRGERLLLGLGVCLLVVATVAAAVAAAVLFLVIAVVVAAAVVAIITMIAVVTVTVVLVLAGKSFASSCISYFFIMYLFMS
jgi:hypothetical protein